MKKISFLIVVLLAITTLYQKAHAADSSWVNDDYADYTPSYSSSATRSGGSSRRSYSSRELARQRDLAPFSPTSNNVSLEIGQIFLMGEMSNYNDTLGGAVRYNYGVSRTFGFDAALGRSSHSEGKLSMLSLTSGVRMNLSNVDRLVPNLKAGMGFYRPSREAGILGNVSSTNFGIYMGGGVDLQLTREMFFGASLNLNNVFGSTKETSAGPVSLGGSYMSFLASVGYTF